MKKIKKQNINNIKKIFEEKTGTTLPQNNTSIISFMDSPMDRRFLVVTSLVVICMLAGVVYLKIRNNELSNNKNENPENLISVSDNDESYSGYEDNEMLGDDNEKVTYIYDMDETQQCQIRDNDVPDSSIETTSHNYAPVEENISDNGNDIAESDTDNTSMTYGMDEDNDSHTPATEEEVLIPSVQMVFVDVNDTVTAKDETNLRDIPSQGEESTVLYTLKNGETVTRTGVSELGWSRLSYNGVTCYAVTSLLTTDLSYSPTAPEPSSGFKTQFTSCNETVTAKEYVNLRSKPSVTDEDSVVVYTLYAGESVVRTGINTDVGWSRVVYNGQTLYCISSYIKVVE